MLRPTIFIDNKKNPNFLKDSIALLQQILHLSENNENNWKDIWTNQINFKLWYNLEIQTFRG